MPERFLRDDYSEDEKKVFFELLNKRFEKTSAIIAIVISAIVACAIALPVSLYITNATNSVNSQNRVLISQQHCDDIYKLRNSIVSIIKDGEKTPIPIKLSAKALKQIHQEDEKAIRSLNIVCTSPKQ